MKAVRGSNRAATKAPRKQIQEKSKKTTAKRAANDQVKCPRAVQCLHFSDIVSLVLWCLTRFHVQDSDLSEDGRKTQQKPAKKRTGDIFFKSIGCLYRCLHFTVTFSEWRRVVGPRGQETWQPISRSFITEVENVVDLAIL